MEENVDQENPQHQPREEKDSGQEMRRQTEMNPARFQREETDYDDRHE